MDTADGNISPSRHPSRAALCLLRSTVKMEAFFNDPTRTRAACLPARANHPFVSFGHSRIEAAVSEAPPPSLPPSLPLSLSTSLPRSLPLPPRAIALGLQKTFNYLSISIDPTRCRSKFGQDTHSAAFETWHRALPNSKHLQSLWYEVKTKVSYILTI